MSTHRHPDDQYREAPAPRGPRLTGAFVSTVAHASVLAALLIVRGQVVAVEGPKPMVVALVELPPPPPPDISPEEKREPEPAAAAPPRTVIKRPPPPPEIKPLPAKIAQVEDPGLSVSDSQIAGAAAAGSGTGGGGNCDMTRYLQNALRKDARVQSAVAEATALSSRKAMMVWNGDWIQSRGQEGRGLAAVRQAIIWEVGFAPAACRSRPMRGLVQISMNEGAGSARLLVGSDQWRWTDLLNANVQR